MLSRNNRPLAKVKRARNLFYYFQSRCQLRFLSLFPIIRPSSRLWRNQRYPRLRYRLAGIMSRACTVLMVGMGPSVDCAASPHACTLELLTIAANSALPQVYADQPSMGQIRRCNTLYRRHLACIGNTTKAGGIRTRRYRNFSCLCDQVSPMPARSIPASANNANQCNDHMPLHHRSRVPWNSSAQQALLGSIILQSGLLPDGIAVVSRYRYRYSPKLTHP